MKRSGINRKMKHNRVIFLVLGWLWYMPLLAQELVPAPVSRTDGVGFFEFSSRTKVVTNQKKDEAKPLTAIVDELAKETPASRNKRVVLLHSANAKGDAWNEVRLQAYNLSVTRDTVRIEAPSAMGLFYGLQTLRQLTENGKVRCTQIQDVPRYRHRGLLLDCSRHFWPKEFIKKQLDAMAYFKLNRFHFHLVDGGGWRLEIKKYPDLVNKTAFRSHADWDEWIDHGCRFSSSTDKGAYGGYYSQADIQDIVNYAKDRYITVIPEIEMPGHSNEVLYAYPELSCTGKGDGFDLCVGNEKTFVFLTDVLKETMKLFPSEYIHVGGDEAIMRYWKTCPKCIKLYRNHHMTDTVQIQSYLMTRIDSFLTAHGRKMMGWDEVLDGDRISAGTTVVSWRGEKGGIKAARIGHHAVMAPSKYCYLDRYQDEPSLQPKAIGGYTPLDSVYSYNPMPAGLKNTPLENFIDGVQGNLWTEYIDTERYAEYMIYPRLLAIAELGWGTTGAYSDFRKRVIAVMKTLKLRGYHGFDVSTEFGRLKKE